jgi:uncharacterized protein YggU (UPF0235/DUF167 family)
MARPRLPLPDAAAILALADGQGILDIRVSPNASADAVLLPPSAGSRTLIIRTTAAPEHGKANDAVLRLLAKALDRPLSALQLVRGASSRNKAVRIIRP